MIKKVTILGSTGTVGINTLEVIKLNHDKFEVFALTANVNLEKLYHQCVDCKPRYAVLRDEVMASELGGMLSKSDTNTIVLSGVKGLEFVASHSKVDIVMAAIVGAAGLAPSISAASSGKTILLANKEALVMSGNIFIKKIEESGARVLPIDSEHNAIFQCLPSLAYENQSLKASGVKKLLLTGSGGPFRLTDIEDLENVSPEEACAHPNWVMGKKISVDSATMMNKGLEIIEACFLFRVDPSIIDVVIHPESIIHSMVEYFDGSIIAQLGNPDMKIPIANALAWPERIESGVDSLDFSRIATFNFEDPDYNKFPCLELAKEAWYAGGTAPAVLNAANEVAVACFLREEIGFLEIPKLVEMALAKVCFESGDSLDEIIAADSETRDIVRHKIKSKNVS